MRAVICEELGPPEQLRIGDLPDPEPMASQVVVDVEAAALNFPDALIIQGKYQFKAAPPFSPGGEVAGTVSAVGDAVTRFKLGDRVMACMPFGGFAEKAVAEQDAVMPIPDGMDATMASAFVLTYATAMHALIDRANVQPKETVLVLGASGGVGIASIQVAKALGARVIAAASTDDKLAACKAAGADEVINYVDGDLKAEAKRLTDGDGVDVVVDSVGGEFSEPALRAIAWEGRFLVVGFAAGDIPKLPLNLVLLKGCQVIGVFWGSFSGREPAKNHAHIERLGAWFQSGLVKPMVTMAYPLEQAPDALRAMLDRKVTGKVVLTVR